MSAHLTCEPRLRQLVNGMTVPGQASPSELVFMPKNIPDEPATGVGYPLTGGLPTFFVLLAMPLHPAVKSIIDAKSAAVR